MNMQVGAKQGKQSEMKEECGERKKNEKKTVLVITEHDQVLVGTCLALVALAGEDAAGRTRWSEACDCAP